ncbi:MAG: hypothetical protein Q8R28_13500 [Dehalococcoidia bacterium]|nr:hypothetical protein [Dehalococcoidia bacterium]
MGRSITPKYRVEYWDQAGFHQEVWDSRPINRPLDRNRTGYGQPTQANLERWRQARNESMLPGKVNEQVSKMYGYMPHISRAQIVHNVPGKGSVVAEVRAPAFEVVGNPAPRPIDKRNTAARNPASNPASESCPNCGGALEGLTVPGKYRHDACGAEVAYNPTKARTNPIAATIGSGIVGGIGFGLGGKVADALWRKGGKAVRGAKKSNVKVRTNPATTVPDKPAVKALKIHESLHFGRFILTKTQRHSYHLTDTRHPPRSRWGTLPQILEDIQHVKEYDVLPVSKGTNWS